MSSSDSANKLASALGSVKNLVNPADNEPFRETLTPEQRDAALQRELQQVKQINQVISGVINSLNITSENLDTVARGVKNADVLLDMWVNIMSKAEHTQNLMFREDWQGTSRDETLWQEKLEALKHKEEEKRLEELRRQKEEEQKLKKSQEIEEAKRQKEETLRRIVYGKRAGSSTPATRPRSTSVINKSGTPGLHNASQTRTRSKTAPATKPRTTPRSDIPTRSNPTRRT